jgi:hypothetical protein
MGEDSAARIGLSTSEERAGRGPISVAAAGIPIKPGAELADIPDHRKPAVRFAVSNDQLDRAMCTKCNRSYQMGWRQYSAELEEKSKADPEAAPWDIPLKCQKCGQEGVMRAHQCEQCGVVFAWGGLPKDSLDRCPHCRYSRTEALRKARSI